MMNDLGLKFRPNLNFKKIENHSATDACKLIGGKLIANKNITN